MLDVERAGLTATRESEGKLAAGLPSLLFALLTGCLSTLVVLCWMVGFRSLGATLAGLVGVWLALPAALFWLYPSVRAILRFEIARACAFPGTQLMMAAVVGLATLGSCLCAYHFLKEPLGLPPPGTRQRLSSYGLDDSEPGVDVFLICWLTLVNPLMVSRCAYEANPFLTLIPTQPLSSCSLTSPELASGLILEEDCTQLGSSRASCTRLVHSLQIRIHAVYHFDDHHKPQNTEREIFILYGLSSTVMN
ncbi:MAG: hypothetical protein SGPRY_004544 [Prymnesium sp.]